MQGTLPAARVKLIERIVRASRQHATRGNPALTADFIRQYYRGVAEEDLAEYQPADLRARALDHLSFGAVRAADQLLVNVSAVQTHHQGQSVTHTVIDVIAPDMPF